LYFVAACRLADAVSGRLFVAAELSQRSADGPDLTIRPT
jgi:hypothetical protein